MTIGTYTFHKTKGLISTQSPGTDLCVADSWLLNQGKVCGLSLHRQRFIQSCLNMHNIPVNVSEQFWNCALRKMPATGQWFPRLELVRTDEGNYCFQVRIRPCPPLQTETTLYTQPIKDKRIEPKHKGPDIASSMLIRKSILPEAKEAIVCTPDSSVLEGLSSSILWWEDNTLCATPIRLRILPGVTRQLITQIAQTKGITVKEKCISFESLFLHEVWAVNALHGIQLVRNALCTPQSPARISTWTKALFTFAEPIAD